jgi:hypothetical protein
VTAALRRALEVLHGVVHHAPEARGAYAGLGLRGSWEGYCASRTAALGRPGARLVTAVLFGFAPRTVARAVPGVWERADPADVLAVRAALARGVLGTHTAGVPLRRLETTADRLDAVAAGLDLAGRPLAAAHADVPVPAEPLTRIWHAATVLHEHRWGGHVAALVAAGVDGPQSHLWRGADPRRSAHLGHTRAEWEAAARALRERGWSRPDGRLTAAGAAARLAVERRTDAAAALPGLDGRAADDLLDVLGPIAASVVRHGAAPHPDAADDPAAVPAGAGR